MKNILFIASEAVPFIKTGGRTLSVRFRSVLIKRILMSGLSFQSIFVSKKISGMI